MYPTAAAAVAVVLVVLAGSLQPGAGAAPSTQVDLTGPATATNCEPCHGPAGESRGPDVVFDHDTHAGVDCGACHLRPPHEAGRTHTPPMEVCFACHGLVHGEGGVLAPDACDACHTATFELRPSDHLDDWARSPHARAAESDGPNACLMCHDAVDQCDACHRSAGVDTAPVPPVYVSTLPLAVSGPPVVIETGEPVTMGQCIHCHPHLDEGTNDDLLFAHDAHLERGYRCAVCHAEFPHEGGKSARPDMTSCYRCHGVLHTTQGEAAPADCKACHPPGFDLVPADHTAAFVSSTHGEPATEGLLECLTCHTSAFCAECHRAEKRLPDGTFSREVIPDDHDADEWIGEHGEPFLLSGEATCSICHTNESCSRCHPTVMPHPTTWLSTHTSSGLIPDDCDVCHSDRNWCQECHHDPDRSQELLAENCDNCHPEMSDTPFAEIEVAKIAEHAAHFEVEDHVGRPHRCEDCHVKLTAARVQHSSGHSTEIGGHDIRVCYGCHGVRDADGGLIAPWPGSELCKRCHTGPDL
ncbi:MAG TPA: cytochrome c3 family protein [Thermoleophilia bacterium]|nr:cytochrome c3 family protein [Thermoleophilia bacterium]